MAMDQTRIRVQKLRSQGKSIKDIVKISGASKSTVSYWCRDIALSTAQIKRLAEQMKRGGERGRLHAAEKKRSLRFNAIEAGAKDGQRDVGTLSKRDLFILGLALYWGEGYKRGNEECGLTNTDPYIIKTFIYWLKHAYQIPAHDLILRVTINETHRARSHQIEKYWAKQTSIPLSQFTQPSFIHTAHSRSFENPEKYVGTLRIKVRRGTALRRRILGSLKEMARQIDALND
ncbi:hypothetical protein HYT05_00870 [Candidatus Kaiserbacteria bacterium]|nr:hypothetical protein [Candidatus Kaiserbacteria bacterium]